MTDEGFGTGPGAFIAAGITVAVVAGLATLLTDLDPALCIAAAGTGATLRLVIDHRRRVTRARAAATPESKEEPSEPEE